MRRHNFEEGMAAHSKAPFTWCNLLSKRTTVIKPVWQPGKCLYTRYNRMSNPLSNGFDNRLYRVYQQPVWQNGCIVYTAGCTTRFDNRLNEQWLIVQHGCQTGCQTGFYNRFDNRVERTVCSFNTVVKPCLSNRFVKPCLSNRFDKHVLTTGYTVVQPAVKPVWQPVWQPAVSCTGTQTFNRLSKRFDNRLDVCLHDTAGCETGCRPTAGLTTGCIV